MSTSIASLRQTGDKEPVTTLANRQRVKRLRRTLLACGVVTSLWYVGMNIFVPTRFPGYSVVSQAVSELSAIGAPTRPLWVFLTIPYILFVIAFGAGVIGSAGRSRPLKTAGILIILSGVMDIFWPPMHLRGAQFTMTDTMHIVFSVVAVLLMLAIIISGAVSLGRRFRFYSIVTLCIFILFGTLTGFDAPRLAANLPTPWLGIWERINIGAYMLWLMVFATMLLRRENKG